MMEKVLLEKKRELRSIINEIEQKQASVPPGNLKISKVKRNDYYYHYLKEQKELFPKGKYISRKNQKLICSLAQSEYEKKVLKWAKECLAKLENLTRVYGDKKYLEIYEKMIPGKKELITPYQLPDTEYIKQWQEQPYTGKDMDARDTRFITEKGETVRSKSEKILADHFAKMGIPYKYECPLKLKGYGTVYPDFTLLNICTREEFYWEHLGMMDNPEYAQKAVMKIQCYEQNGIFPGKGLLLSYEMKNNLNMDAVDALIQEFLV